MRVPNSVHEQHPWRIRELARDFTLEDVWELPARGGAGDFPLLLEVFRAFDPENQTSLAARFLWRVREVLGNVFGWDEKVTLPIPGATESRIAERLPADLRGTASSVSLAPLPFEPVYLTRDEFAAEISNSTVHGILHLAWAPQPDGSFCGQMAVYVKPRGMLGRLYMPLIRPFRYAIVYPAMMRRIERAWDARMASRPSDTMS
jgi:hypothetical protein